MNEISPLQALQNLYVAARLATLTADQHQALAESAKILEKAITPPSEVKEVAE